MIVMAQNSGADGAATARGGGCRGRGLVRVRCSVPCGILLCWGVCLGLWVCVRRWLRCKVVQLSLWTRLRRISVDGGVQSFWRLKLRASVAWLSLQWCGPEAEELFSPSLGCIVVRAMGAGLRRMAAEAVVCDGGARRWSCKRTSAQSSRAALAVLCAALRCCGLLAVALRAGQSGC